MKGPKLQSDLFDNLLAFQFHAIALVGDIEKMFRKVLVDEEDRFLQKIYGDRVVMNLFANTNCVR